MKGKIIDKVALISISDKKVLTALSKSKSKLYLPGGKREPNESDIECLKREIKEELNVEIKEDSIRYFDTFEAPADGKNEDILVKMTCYFADYSGTLEASSEIESFEWIGFEDRHRTSAVVALILDRLKALNLISSF
ncbi:MAG: NUDIX domain-containing protein [Candidatus Chryseobacterium colombiense]|nr:NUDIX domain-containing protein [Chryseobacterium sp.]WEK71278.1 MAG: NUDIX domain-containing protein [Chryseobacterium sp.]